METLQVKLRDRLVRAATVGAIPLIASIAGAHAQVTISSGSNTNIFCANGVCQPTADTAVLNKSYLAGLLGSGSVTVTTTGSLTIQANDIVFADAFSWSTSNGLTLTANQHITIDKKVTVRGISSLAMTTNMDPGALSFGDAGSVVIDNLSSALTINGNSYTLENTIAGLANDIGNHVNPNGDYAFVNDYDASGDGTYSAFPVGEFDHGIVEGLGNAITGFSFSDGGLTPTNGGFVGTLSYGTISDLSLTNVSVVAHGNYSGGLAATEGNGAVLIGDSVSGTVISAIATGCSGGQAGGLIGYSAGNIYNCHSSAKVSGAAGAGGLVGQNGASIIANSYAIGSVSGSQAGAYVGGLVAGGGGPITDSYATGKVTGFAGGALGSAIGGLAGFYQGVISNSFASGEVRETGGGENAFVGGLVGWDYGSFYYNDYASGAVSSGAGSKGVGGLIGYSFVNDSGVVNYSYSSGRVKAGKGSSVGGLIGFVDASQGSTGPTITASYWDTDTSGITNLSQGVGNIRDYGGISGLTTSQFESEWPFPGWDTSVWGENANVCGGLPYLLPPLPQCPP